MKWRRRDRLVEHVVVDHTGPCVDQLRNTDALSLIDAGIYAGGMTRDQLLDVRLALAPAPLRTAVPVIPGRTS